MNLLFNIIKYYLMNYDQCYICYTNEIKYSTQLKL